MKILFLQYPKCSTCRKAEKWLEEHNIDVVSRHIVEENPTKEELITWIGKSHLPIQKFFNTSGQVYRAMDLKDKVKIGQEDELIELLASNGMLIKRPIIVAEDFVLVGFKEDEWKTKLI